MQPGEENKDAQQQQQQPQDECTTAARIEDPFLARLVGADAKIAEDTSKREHHLREEFGAAEAELQKRADATSAKFKTLLAQVQVQVCCAGGCVARMYMRRCQSSNAEGSAFAELGGVSAAQIAVQIGI